MLVVGVLGLTAASSRVVPITEHLVASIYKTSEPSSVVRHYSLVFAEQRSSEGRRHLQAFYLYVLYILLYVQSF